MNPVLFLNSAWRFMLKALNARGRAMFRQPSSIGLPKLRQSGGVPFLAPIALFGAALLAVPASGQEWAEKMFSVTSHNFGTVAKGSKTEFRFIYRNLYEEDVHVSSVRTSCGCTQPAITKKLIETHETGEIVAAFNTRTFLGQHGATLTVTFDQPFYAEVQLRVAGNIRGDVTFEPASVNLGNVDLGRGAEQVVRVTHMGSTPWEITDVRSANVNFEVLLSQPQHTGSQSAYDLTLRLKPDAPSWLYQRSIDSCHRRSKSVTDPDGCRRTCCRRGDCKPPAPRTRERFARRNCNKEYRRAGQQTVFALPELSATTVVSVARRKKLLQRFIFYQ